MGVLNWITQGCDALTATASPTIDALGVRMCIALATIMLVWFGVQESLASTLAESREGLGRDTYPFPRLSDSSNMNNSPKTWLRLALLISSTSTT